MTPRVAVIAGGLSPEREVSLRSGRRVAEALRATGVEVSVLDVDATLLSRLADEAPDVVVPLLHGQAGEDGSLAEVLSLFGIPYVGSVPAAARAAFDKTTARAVVSTVGLAVPDGVVLPHATFRALGSVALIDALVSHVGLPMVVKPSSGGSALGAGIVNSRADLPTALVAAFGYAESVLVEARRVGTEVAVSVVDLGDGPVALPAVEIVVKHGFYDYPARYTAGATEFFAPARLEPAVAAACAEAALTAHGALGLRDLSRSDLIVDADGTPWFLEANVVPGTTETSLLPQALAAAGLQLGPTFRTLVERAQARGAR